MLVVPVYNMILAPEATLYLQTEQLKRSSGGKGASVNERVILIVAKENENFNEMTEESFYPIGIAGVIREITQDGHAAIRLQYRVNVESVAVNPDHTIELTIFCIATVCLQQIVIEECAKTEGLALQTVNEHLLLGSRTESP